MENIEQNRNNEMTTSKTEKNGKNYLLNKNINTVTDRDENINTLILQRKQGKLRTRVVNIHTKLVWQKILKRFSLISLITNMKYHLENIYLKSICNDGSQEESVGEIFPYDVITEKSEKNSNISSLRNKSNFNVNEIETEKKICSNFNTRIMLRRSNEIQKNQSNTNQNMKNEQLVLSSNDRDIISDNINENNLSENLLLNITNIQKITTLECVEKLFFGINANRYCDTYEKIKNDIENESDKIKIEKEMEINKKMKFDNNRKDITNNDNYDNNDNNVEKSLYISYLSSVNIINDITISENENENKNKIGSLNEKVDHNGETDNKKENQNSFSPEKSNLRTLKNTKKRENYNEKNMIDEKLNNSYDFTLQSPLNRPNLEGKVSSVIDPSLGQGSHERKSLECLFYQESINDNKYHNHKYNNTYNSNNNDNSSINDSSINSNNNNKNNKSNNNNDNNNKNDSCDNVDNNNDKEEIIICNLNKRFHNAINCNINTNRNPNIINHNKGQSKDFYNIVQEQLSREKSRRIIRDNIDGIPSNLMKSNSGTFTKPLQLSSSSPSPTLPPSSPRRYYPYNITNFAETVLLKNHFGYVSNVINNNNNNNNNKSNSNSNNNNKNSNYNKISNIFGELNNCSDSERSDLSSDINTNILKKQNGRKCATIHSSTVHPIHLYQNSNVTINSNSQFNLSYSNDNHNDKNDIKNNNNNNYSNSNGSNNDDNNNNNSNSNSNSSNNNNYHHKNNNSDINNNNNTDNNIDNDNNNTGDNGSNDNNKNNDNNNYNNINKNNDDNNNNLMDNYHERFFRSMKFIMTYIYFQFLFHVKAYCFDLNEVVTQIHHFITLNLFEKLYIHFFIR